MWCKQGGHIKGRLGACHYSSTSSKQGPPQLTLDRHGDDGKK